MPERVIDYTSMRTGSRPNGGARRIGVCPVCGLKGLIAPAFINQRGTACPGNVIHRQTVSPFGLPSSAPGDWCSLEENEPCPLTATAATD